MGSVGIVSGSGIDLSGLLDEVHERRSFDEFMECPSGDLVGHERCFVRGLCHGKPVVVQCGRFHFYEGFSYDRIVKPVDIFQRMGVTAVVFTNAAGGLLPALKPGDLMAVTEIQLWPCQRWPGHPETIMPDFEVVGCTAASTYAWLHGPCYETRAEIEALRRMDAGAVGMSAAPELLRCQELGIRGGVVSCITNACGSPQKLTHKHVVETAQRASGQLVEILRAFLASWTEV